MNKRKQQSNRIGRRSMVALLALIMLISMCVPGLTAGASEMDTAQAESTPLPAEPEQEETVVSAAPLSEEPEVLLAGEEDTLPDFSDVTPTIRSTGVDEDGNTINDTIEAKGRIYVDAALAGYTPVYTWYDQDGNAVVRRDYTNGAIVEHNVAEDGSWLNVAVAQGGKKTFTVKVTGYVTTDENGNTVYAELPKEYQSKSAAYTVTYSNKLLNGSFETPDIEGKKAADFAGQLYPDNGTDYDHDENQMQFLEGTSGLEWKTTSSCNSVEIINVTNNTLRDDGSYTVGPTFGAHGVLFAADGMQAAELNAQAAGALYQDVLTVPGTTMHWQLQHMGRPVYGNINKNNDWPRWNGPVYNSYQANPRDTAKDTMYVLIMPTELAKNPTIDGVAVAGINGEIDNQNEVTTAMKAFENNSKVQIVPITYEWYWVNLGNSVYEMYHKDINGNWVRTYTVNFSSSKNRTVVQHADPWVVSKGDYDVQANTYLTRYFFVAGDTEFGGNNSVGNHIDNIYFGIELPDPVEGSANLQVVKKLEGVAAEDLETVKKSLQFNIEVGGQTLTVYGYDDPNEDELHLSWNGLEGTYAKNFAVNNGSTLDYKVTETITSGVGNYKLESVKVNDETVTGGTYEAAGTLHSKGNETVTFTNTYAPQTTDVTISKTVSGNMGDWNKSFKFTVALTGGTFSGSTYTVTDKNNVSGSPVSITDGKDSVDIDLKHGESVKITNVPIGATLTVTESDNANYTVTTEVTNAVDADTNNNDSDVSFEVPNKEVTVAYTNKNEVTINTGIFMDSLPYILLLTAVAAGAILLILNKRRYSGKF